MLLFLGLEIERQAVGAVTQARGRGAVWKDVPKMRVAFGAADFSPAHEVAPIINLDDRIL